jgi:hypothetical protein
LKLGDKINEDYKFIKSTMSSRMNVTIFGWLNRRYFKIMADVSMLLPLTVNAEYDRSRHSVIYGKTANGIHKFCGLPVFSLPLPSPLRIAFRSTNLGHYKPGGALPAKNCNDVIIVITTTDLNFLAAEGVPEPRRRVERDYRT